ncbi:cytochrome P450 [Seiridium cupressi]
MRAQDELNMALPDYLWGRFSSSEALSQILAPVAALIVAYCIGRVVYNLKFHPLSKYPGPKLAATTDIWWAYVRTTGRYPWIIENVFKRYGDVVRITPNELVFLKPQAAKGLSYLGEFTAIGYHTNLCVYDRYISFARENLELFVQVDYDALDTGDGEISGETNPVKHREIAKKLAPAFSTRNFKAKEASVSEHIDLFIRKNEKCSDLSADMTYGLEMGQVRDTEYGKGQLLI